MPNLDELDRLEREATAGEWEAWPIDERDHYTKWGFGTVGGLSTDDMYELDAAFIVAARNSMRPLLTLLADMGGALEYLLQEAWANAEVHPRHTPGTCKQCDKAWDDSIAVLITWEKAKGNGETWYQRAKEGQA